MAEARISVGSLYTIITLTAVLCITFMLRFSEASARSRHTWIALAIVTCAVCLLRLIAFQRGMRHAVQVTNILLCIILGAIAATTIVALHRHNLSPPHIVTNVNERATVEGIVTERPDRRPTHTRYVIDVDLLVTDSEEPISAHGRMLVADYDDWPRYKRNDRLRVTGRLESPEPIDHYRYDRALAARGIYVTMRRPTTSLTHTGSISIGRILDDIANAIDRRIALIFPEPDAALLSGMLLGRRGWLGQGLEDTFDVTGLTHILAVSGFNITLVLAFLHALLSLITIRLRVPFLLAGIIIYALLTGAEPPVIRAAIMGGLGLFAILARRQTHTWLAILWSAALMSALNPRLLWDDASFQLSFLAVIGITLLSPVLSKLLRRVPDALGMRTALIATLGAQAGTLPLTILVFRQVSFVSPVSNALIAPLIPLAMLGGTAATVVSAFSLQLGRLIGFVVHPLLMMIVWITELLSAIPFAAVTFGK